MTAELLTFGCRLNAYESEVMRALAPPGQLVVNTCAVTAEAERQARQAIRRAVRAAPGRPITVTGCAAQRDPAAWRALPGVTRILGNAEKLRPASWTHTADAVADIMSAPPVPARPVTAFAGRARAFVQVQQGCDHRCTFCAIPFGRGPNRSVPETEILAQARSLLEAGYQEIVLTGVDIASYGMDVPGTPRLGTLARRLLAALPDLPRLRFSSLDPAAIDAALWRLLAEEPRLMPHLHLSLQAGSDLILKRMRRRHLTGDAAGAIARARDLRPGIAIGADLIAGFPTETDALFAETLDFVTAAALPYLHVFPYSERPGTPAARMPAIPVATRRARAAQLRAAAAGPAFFAAQLGRIVQVLTEADAAGYSTGHSEHFAPVRLTATSPPGAILTSPMGRIVAARVTAADAAGLIAAPL